MVSAVHDTHHVVELLAVDMHMTAVSQLIPILDFFRNAYGRL